MVKVERKVFSSVRILSDSSKDIERSYEHLANLIGSYGGRIHGSQSHPELQDFYGSIVVYFEIPIENKEAFIKEENIHNGIDN